MIIYIFFKFEFYSVPLLKCRGQKQGEKVFNPPSSKHFTHNWVAKVDWRIVENLARVFLYPLLVVAKSSICNLVTHRVDGTRIDANLVISPKLVWDFAPNAAYLSKCWIVISPSNWPRTSIATLWIHLQTEKKTKLSMTNATFVGIPLLNVIFQHNILQQVELIRSTCIFLWTMRANHFHSM